MDDSLFEKLESRNENDIKDAISEFNNKNAKSFSFPDYSVDAKKKLLDLIFKQLTSNENCRLPCLQAARILSRDKVQVENVFTKQMIATLVNLAGLTTEEKEVISQCDHVPDPNVIIEAQKILCNLIYNNSSIQRECCANGCIEGIMLRLRTYKDSTIPHEAKFFDMRMLFLLTAFCADMRPKLRTELHGLIYLMEVLDLILKINAESIAKQVHRSGSKKWFNRNSKKGKKKPQPEYEYVPCLTNQEVDMACEVLKVLFNLTVTVEKHNVEEEEVLYLRLVSILHDILLCDTETPEKKEELQSHTVDLLTNMPSATYEELLTPAIDVSNEDIVEYEGMNMEAINILLEFLSKRLNRPNKTHKELISPILTTLGEASRSNRCIRKFLRHKVLPPLKDVMKRPEEGSTLRNRLVKLMTSPVYDVKELVADFLFVLCKENVTRLIKYTGYGNAAGLLANRGLMLGGRGNGNYSSDSEESDTEEYLKYKNRINPVVGCYQELKSNPMEGMSEEEKEYEAMQLVSMMHKMARDGLVQPMRVGDDGKPYAVSHILELQEGFGLQVPSKGASDSD